MINIEIKNTGLSPEQEQVFEEHVKCMAKKLKDNVDKGDWDKCDDAYLTSRLLQETAELVLSLSGDGLPKIARESADVSNFAMMLADKRRRENA